MEGKEFIGVIVAVCDWVLDRIQTAKLTLEFVGCCCENQTMSIVIVLFSDTNAVLILSKINEVKCWRLTKNLD